MSRRTQLAVNDGLIAGVQPPVFLQSIPNVKMVSWLSRNAGFCAVHPSTIALRSIFNEVELSGPVEVFNRLRCCRVPTAVMTADWEFQIASLAAARAVDAVKIDGAHFPRVFLESA